MNEYLIALALLLLCCAFAPAVWLGSMVWLSVWLDRRDQEEV